MYRLADGKILMRGHLEALPMSCAPQKVSEDFLVNPNTLKYDQVAFTPATTPRTTLNYWVPPSLKLGEGGLVSLSASFYMFVICNGDRKLFVLPHPVLRSHVAKARGKTRHYDRAFRGARHRQGYAVLLATKHLVTNHITCIGRRACNRWV